MGSIGLYYSNSLDVVRRSDLCEMDPDGALAGSTR